MEEMAFDPPVRYTSACHLGQRTAAGNELFV